MIFLRIGHMRTQVATMTNVSATIDDARAATTPKMRIPYMIRRMGDPDSQHIPLSVGVSVHHDAMVNMVPGLTFHRGCRKRSFRNHSLGKEAVLLMGGTRRTDTTCSVEHQRHHCGTRGRRKKPTDVMNGFIIPRTSTRAISHRRRPQIA